MHDINVKYSIYLEFTKYLHKTTCSDQQAILVHKLPTCL